LVSLANIIKNKDQDYTVEEKKAIMEGKKFYMDYKESKNFEDLNSPDSRVKMKLVHIDRTSIATGFATTVVDASVEECAAHAFSKLGNREHKRVRQKQGISFLKVINVNPHTLHFATTRELGVPGLSPRDTRSKVIWSKDKNGNILVDASDTSDLNDKFPVKTGNVLATAHSLWVCEPLEPIAGVAQTALTAIVKAELRGNIPSSIMKRIAPKFLTQVSDFRKKFDKSEEIDAANRELLQEEM
jgi:hypothetical protein